VKELHWYLSHYVMKTTATSMCNCMMNIVGELIRIPFVTHGLRLA